MRDMKQFLQMFITLFFSIILKFFSTPPNGNWELQKLLYANMNI